MAYYESNVFGNLSEIVDKACKKKKKRRYKSRELIKAWSNPRAFVPEDSLPLFPIFGQCAQSIDPVVVYNEESQDTVVELTNAQKEDNPKARRQERESKFTTSDNRSQRESRLERERSGTPSALRSTLSSSTDVKKTRTIVLSNYVGLGAAR